MNAVGHLVWNFALTGEARSGAGAVATAVNARREAVCHADLFHRDDAVRRAAHEAYFGPTADEEQPEWFVDGVTNPWQYVERTVVDNPRRDEAAVGFYVPYGVVRKWELYELFEQKCREGSFGVVHVVRNPVACYVSLKQAEHSGVWTRGPKEKGAARPPSPVRVDAGDLLRFCRDHAATTTKIRDACRDRLEVSYRDVVYDFQKTMRRVFDYVELPEVPSLAKAGCKRLRNRPVLDRISNLTELRLDLPTEVRRLLDDEDLL